MLYQIVGAGKISTPTLAVDRLLSQTESFELGDVPTSQETWE